jgi:hypothetical protein
MAEYSYRRGFNAETTPALVSILPVGSTQKNTALNPQPAWVQRTGRTFGTLGEILQTLAGSVALLSALDLVPSRVAKQCSSPCSSPCCSAVLPSLSLFSLLDVRYDWLFNLVSLVSCAGLSPLALCPQWSRVPCLVPAGTCRATLALLRCCSSRHILRKGQVCVLVRLVSIALSHDSTRRAYIQASRLVICTWSSANGRR